MGRAGRSGRRFLAAWSASRRYPASAWAAVSGCGATGVIPFHRPGSVRTDRSRVQFHCCAAISSPQSRVYRTVYSRRLLAQSAVSHAAGLSHQPLQFHQGQRAGHLRDRQPGRRLIWSTWCGSEDMRLQQPGLVVVLWQSRPRLGVLVIIVRLSSSRMSLASSPLGAIPDQLVGQLAGACAGRCPARRRPRGPCSRASSAVHNEPLPGLPSTTSTPSDRPLMMRLRGAKFRAVRARAGRVVAEHRALGRDALGQGAVLGWVYSRPARSPAPPASDRRRPARPGAPAPSIPRASPLTMVTPAWARSVTSRRVISMPSLVGLRVPTTATAHSSSGVSSPLTYSTGGAALIWRRRSG